MLSDIHTGRFVRDLTAENQAGQAMFKAARRINDAHQIEAVGEAHAP